MTINNFTNCCFDVNHYVWKKNKYSDYAIITASVWLNYIEQMRGHWRNIEGIVQGDKVKDLNKN